MADSLTEAAARLEAAVERLARVAANLPRPSAPVPTRMGVPVEEVAALSARLEATIARLRAALPEGSPVLAEEDGAEEADMVELDPPDGTDGADRPEGHGGPSGP